MSSDAEHRLAKEYDLEEAALAGATTAEADEVRDALARAERLAVREDEAESDLHAQAVEDTAEQLAQLEATHDVDLASHVPGLEESAALQAALASAEEDLEPDDEETETAELSDAERAEKRELEARLADLRDKDSDLAEEEADRVEDEIEDLLED